MAALGAFYIRYPSAAAGSNPSVGPNGSTAPTESNQVGFVDGSGNLQPFSGVSAGSGPNVAVTSSALPTGAATASLQTTGNTSLATIATNTTGVATAANQTTGNTSLSTIATNTAGVATAANQSTGNASLATIATNTPALGQALMAASSPVVIASNQSAIPVTITDSTASGSVTTQNLNPNSGAATAGSTVAVTSLNGQTSWSVQVTGTYTGALTPQVSVDGTNWIALSATAVTNINTNAQAATIASAAVGIFEISAPPCAELRMTALAAVTGTAVVTIRVSSSTTRIGLDSPLPAGTAIIGALSANQSTNTAQINGVAPLMGNGVTGTGSLRVTLASDTTSNTNPLLVSEQPSATATLTSVAGSATTVSLLASNTSRKQASFFNDSTAVLYLAFASTASTTAYTVQLVANAYYELPSVHIYNGAISGIWASAAGNVRITELS